MNILNQSKSHLKKVGMTISAARNLSRQVPFGKEVVAIQNAAIVDAKLPEPRHNCVIVIEDGMIADVGFTADIEIPATAKLVDAQGMFVIPGLWDMHVHQFRSDYLPLNIVNGVTGVRMMSGIPEHLKWREQSVAGQITAPRMALSSLIIDGLYPLRPGSISVRDEVTARQAVRDSQASGFDFVKVYNLIPKEAFTALANEAKNQAIPFAGHIPLSLSLAETSALGIASVEHLEGILIASSAMADELQAQIQKLEIKSLMDMQSVQQIVYQAAHTHDSNKLKQVIDTLAKNGTWQTPTLAVLHASALAGGEDFPLTKYLPYMEPQLRSVWEQAFHYAPNEQQRLQAKKLFELYLQIVGELNRCKIPLLAGTDTFVPGYSLHDELSLLVTAGLSNHEALCAATSKPAEFLGVTDCFGTIERGKVADLVLLKSNPLDNISNTQDIEYVLLGGTLLNSQTLANIYDDTMKRISPQ